jgi:predicted nuclease of restriction endonuclease-like (RecB) superfamily
MNLLRGRNVLPDDYPQFIADLKARIRQAQIKAALSVNHELVLLYFDLGASFVIQQERAGWGDKVMGRISQDLMTDFPEIKGFSRRNLYRMRSFYLAFRDRPEFVPQAAAQIPWFHSVVILEKIKDPKYRDWYVQSTIDNGWSRPQLEREIESKVHLRQGSAATNFHLVLPESQSALAQQVLKDPYNFDFLSLGKEAHERDLERGLLEHLKAFMLELGVGFSFVGSQYHLEVGSKDYYIDLLFYHLKLRCFVVVDLKVVDFEPEFAGKMNFYLSVVDDLLRHPSDAPTIGIILCKSQDRTIAEYTLRDIKKPLGVSTYELAEALPKELEGVLPTVEQLEAELDRLNPDPPAT